MLSDPIADMLTRIRNGYLGRKNEVAVPYSKIKEEIGKILVKNTFLKKINQEKIKVKNTAHKFLVCQLLYQNQKPVITKIIRVSKPGLRVYVKRKKIPRVLRGMGIAIISTPKGIMIGKDARKQQLGGELICKVW